MTTIDHSSELVDDYVLLRQTVDTSLARLYAARDEIDAVVLQYRWLSALAPGVDDKARERLDLDRLHDNLRALSVVALDCERPWNMAEVVDVGRPCS